MANIEEVRKILELFSNSADNQLIMTEDDNFFFITNDSNIQHNAGSKFDQIITTSEVRIGYHNFFEVKGLSRKKENQKKLVFAICPFMIQNDSNFSKILRTLLEKTAYGKKNILINIIGRSAFIEAQNNGHSTTEICTDPQKCIPNNYTNMITNFQLLLTTYQEIIELGRKIPECIPSLCPVCRNNFDNKQIVTLEVELKLDVTNPETMMTHHTQIWNVVNNSREQKDFIRYGIYGDTRKQYADLNVSVKTYKGKKLKIIYVDNWDPQRKGITVKLDKAIKANSTKLLKLEWDWEEPERYFSYTFSTYCKRFRYVLTAPKSIEINPQISKVDPKTKVRSILDSKVKIHILRDSKKAIWETSDIVPPTTIKLDW